MTGKNLRLLWIITAVVCGVWGVSFGVVPALESSSTYLWVGAAVCGVLFVAALVCSIIWLVGRRRTA